MRRRAHRAPCRRTAITSRSSSPPTRSTSPTRRCRRAKAAIETRLGLRVLLTRDDDRNVPLDERTSMANNNKADLFISLHANASMRPSTIGLTIFCAAFDKDAAQAASAGGSERVPTFGGGSRDIEMVPWDLAQTRPVGQP